MPVIPPMLPDIAGGAPGAASADAAMGNGPCLVDAVGKAAFTIASALRSALLHRIHRSSVIGTLVSVSYTPSAPWRCRTVPQLFEAAVRVAGHYSRFSLAWSQATPGVPVGTAVGACWLRGAGGFRCGSPPWGCCTRVCHFAAVAADKSMRWAHSPNASFARHSDNRPGGRAVAGITAHVTTRFAR